LVTVSAQAMDFCLCLGRDEKLLRRLNEIDNAETCTVRIPGESPTVWTSDAKWRLSIDDVIPTLWQLANGSRS